MSKTAIQILWDNSYIWGLMAQWALCHLDIPYKLVSAREIAQGSLGRNPPGILLVPGGSAKLKAGALGGKGLKAIRDWVNKGGFYLGFCGGAGLALTSSQSSMSLNLCPWNRHSYSERLYHLLSGHIIVNSISGTMSLPVWWPGRFEPGSLRNITILASYKEPARDLWIADMPVSLIPATIRKEWQILGFLDKNLHLPVHHPITITGQFGKGRYLLSYAHLETPASPDANKWLVELLNEYSSLQCHYHNIKNWNFESMPNHIPASPCLASILDFFNKLTNLVNLGSKMGIFYPRTSWLTGWHPDMPGMIFNHLRWCAYSLSQLPANACVENYWNKIKKDFASLLDTFCLEAEAFMWNNKLNSTLLASNANSLKKDAFQNDRLKIFGHPMAGNGLAQTILNELEIMYFHAQK